MRCKLFLLLSAFVILFLVLGFVNQPAHAAMVCDVDEDGDIDRDDINLIIAVRNTPASGPDDPRDADGDGMITALDARKCVLKCTLPRCEIVKANQPPVANAGEDQNIIVGDLVTLDGRNSSDPDGDLITYNWTILAIPSGSSAVLNNPTSVMPTVVPDLPGDYIFSLIVNDGKVDSYPDDVVVIAALPNVAPTANAGPDQSVITGSLVYLDGTGSFDPDGNPLTYNWQILSLPAGSTTSLDDSTSPTPSFSADLDGEYVFSLTVNDGLINSAPDNVVVISATPNAPPVADTGDDQTVSRNTMISLDGTRSSDPDGDPLTYSWSIVSRPEGSTSEFDDPTFPTPEILADREGDFVFRLVVNDGELDSAPDTVVVTVVNNPPVANAGQDMNAFVGQEVMLDGSQSSDVDGDLLTFQWSFTSMPDGSSAALSDPTLSNPAFVPDLAGLYVVQLIVHDGTVNSIPDTATITVTVAECLPSTTRSCYEGPTGTLGVGECRAGIQTCGSEWYYEACLGQVLPTTEIPNNGIDEDCNGLDAQCIPETVQPCYTGPSGTEGIGICRAGTITCASDGMFGACEGQILPITEIPNNGIDEDCNGQDATTGTPLPPDPASVAPPIDPTVATTVATATEFLYTGTNPIQTGVAEGTIEKRRAAVIRGKVLDKNNNALPGVTITILNHPEFGQTLSRLDGMFDMAVNGGGYLTVNYQKSGYLPAQRQINAPWQDYVWLPDVILVQLDNQVTSVDLTSSEPIQIARGSVVTDEDGTRQATLLIPQGTQAQLVMPDGSTQPITSFSVRASEYTIGPNGPQAMPAELPPTSGYTYAVELSADEAIGAGAVEVRFNQPLYYYVEDFIGFPVGGAVPAGYYDRQKGQWIASENGRVIKIISISGEQADLDTDGDGASDDAATLAALGIVDAERRKLAGLYLPGQSLWRVPLTHFSPWDFNWPYGPPLDAEEPKQKEPKTDEKVEIFSIECRSLVECQNQVLRQRVAITGTPFTLSYSSGRVLGRRAAYTLDIPLSGDTLPASVMRIVLYIDVAGRQFSQSFPPQTNLSYRFEWDGLDVYGRRVLGMQQATVRIGYEYEIVYYPVLADYMRSFARMGPSVIFTPSRMGTTIRLWQAWILTLEYPIPGQIGGWTLDAHHSYDGRTLYLGDGTTRGAAAANVISTVAGTGRPGHSGDGGPAIDARLRWPQGVAVGPDGSLYIADSYNDRVRRVAPDGIITTVAQLAKPSAVAVGSDGSLYISEFHYNRIRRVAPDGIITTVAGNGERGDGGDGGLAINAQLRGATGVAVGPDGSLYIAGSFSYRVRRVAPDGIITTVAGNGSQPLLYYPKGDGGPATDATVNPMGVAIGPYGSLYIADSLLHSVRRVAPDGIITTVAGGQGRYSGDGGPAIFAGLGWQYGVAIGPDASLYITDYSHFRVRRVGPDGVITTVAGNGQPVYAGDGGPATNAGLYPLGVAIGPDGSLYIADPDNNRILRVSSFNIQVGEIFVPSEDSGKLYFFDATGRHLRTVSALTGAVIYRFLYDGNGLLTQVEDGDGNITMVERNAAGEPTAIVGPYGQRTTLTLDSNDYLADITSPGGETLHFVYDSGGLLTEMTDAKGNRSVYDYNARGRLVKDSDAAGGSLSLARAGIPNGFDVTTTTKLGEVTTHRTENLPAGGMSMVDTYADGTTVQTVIGTNGLRTITKSDGTVASLQQGPDPRFGMQAPIVTATTVTTRGGLNKVTSMQRTITLSEPNNPLSLLTLTDNVTINGRLYTNVIDTGTMQRTTTSPEGRKLVTTFDAQGRVVRKQFGNLNPINYTFDTRGRMATITQGSGAEAREFTIAYNDQGYHSSMTGPLSANVGLEYDVDGRVSQQTMGDGRTVTYGYDGAGNIASITPPGRPSHLFTYTPINLAHEYVAPDVGAGASVTALAFDKDKRLTSMTRPDGSAITMSYDSAGRPTTKTFPRGTINYGYDPVTGVLSSLTAPDGGVLTIEYDGYLTTKSVWSGVVTGSIDRVYDNNFWLVRRSINGQAIDFGYDNDGLLVQAGALTLTRDATNGLVTGTSLGGMSDTWHYTGFGELDEYRATYNGSDYYAAQYVYDKLGRIVQKTEETIGVVSNVYGYSYDVTSRLTGVSLNGVNIATYTYDSNGNRLSLVSPSTAITGSYDAQDRLTQYGNITYTYTANGELELKTDAGGTTTYQYDALGNLVSVTLPGGTAIEYVIDGANRRIGKKLNNILVKGLLYKDDLKPVAELDAGNNVVSRFVYGSRINVPDYMITPSATYRIVSDHLGSPRLVIDVATSQIAQRLSYDEFGKVVVDTNPGFQPFGFASGLYDPDTGLVRFGARDYDPQTGRWTAKDPILFRVCL